LVEADAGRSALRAGVGQRLRLPDRGGGARHHGAAYHDCALPRRDPRRPIGTPGGQPGARRNRCRDDLVRRPALRPGRHHRCCSPLSRARARRDDRRHHGDWQPAGDQCLAVLHRLHPAERDCERVHRSRWQCLPGGTFLSRPGTGRDHHRGQRAGAVARLAVHGVGADRGMSRPMVRILVDRFFGALIAVSVMLAAIPVLVLLLFVVIKGLPGLLTPGFFTDPPFPQGVPGGGVFNAIIGTLVIVGIGSLLAVPIGSLIGIFLSEYGRNQLGDAVRFISDVLTGLPSIAFGIFGYTVVVLTTHHFSAISASIALAVLMLPVILRATESALVLVPQSLREAGLALGAPRWRVTLEIVVPAALGGIVTGGLLAMARAAGETAPLLFTAFGNDIVQTNPFQPMGALALTVFRNALVPYTYLQDQAWAAALLLVILVATTTILAR